MILRRLNIFFAYTDACISWCKIVVASKRPFLIKVKWLYSPCAHQVKHFFLHSLKVFSMASFIITQMQLVLQIHWSYLNGKNILCASACTAKYIITINIVNYLLLLFSYKPNDFCKMFYPVFEFFSEKFLFCL